MATSHTFTHRFGGYMAAHLDDLAPGDALRQVLGTIAEALRDGDTAAMAGLAHTVGQSRARSGSLLSENNQAFGMVRGAVWHLLEAFLAQGEAWQPAELRAVEDLLHTYRNAFIGGYTETYQQIQHDLLAQSEQIAAQRATIRALSTPVLPLHAGVIALPLVGTIDSFRAGQITEHLLEAVAAQHAEVAIIDITGVPVVDTGVANYLLQSARATRLLGAQVVLAGISPELAQTIVQLGVSFGDLVCTASLREAIAFALTHRRASPRARPLQPAR